MEHARDKNTLKSLRSKQRGKPSMYLGRNIQSAQKLYAPQSTADRSNSTPKDDQPSHPTSSNASSDSSVLTCKMNVKPNTTLCHELIARIMQFLTLPEIMKASLVSSSFLECVKRTSGFTFKFCKKLLLDGKWASLSPMERQAYLSQMQSLTLLKTTPNAFESTKRGGIHLQEVAALLHRNSGSLRVLKLFSSPNPLSDCTPPHDPFALQPIIFPKLRKMSISGCQTLEILHILGNCCFPVVERLSVCHFTFSHNHWSWDVVYDFTSLGVRGLHRILSGMGNLERLTLGFDVWFDSPLVPPPPAGAMGAETKRGAGSSRFRSLRTRLHHHTLLKEREQRSAAARSQSSHGERKKGKHEEEEVDAGSQSGYALDNEQASTLLNSRWSNPRADNQNMAPHTTSEKASSFHPPRTYAPLQDIASIKGKMKKPASQKCSSSTDGQSSSDTALDFRRDSEKNFIDSHRHSRQNAIKHKTTLPGDWHIDGKPQHMAYSPRSNARAREDAVLTSGNSIRTSKLAREKDNSTIRTGRARNSMYGQTLGRDQQAPSNREASPDVLHDSDASMDRPAFRIRSYRGRISEQDFSGVFAVLLASAGKKGKLKRIVLKHRMQEDALLEHKKEDDVNTVTEFIFGTASFCQRYFSGIVRDISGLAS